MEKSKELNVALTLQNDSLHFEGKVDGQEPVPIDYIPPLGDNLGYTSLELLLLSLSSCAASTILIFLRKMQKTVDDFTVSAQGIRKEEHPTGFKTIWLKFELKSENVNEEELEKVIKMSEEQYCPVWTMLKGNVDIFVEYKISKTELSYERKNAQ